ncbi:DUF732 domain-containing protein [Nocardia sp. CC227C]|uniref:DUF732 domain-containing protein n=1 Tax=Nocardia sp. CC227C TaxID=3044562 RepID=UPI00278C4C8D|nr:DUF732 domain-containing protein [Nocardia sp. CC227C]
MAHPPIPPQNPPYPQQPMGQPYGQPPRPPKKNNTAIVLLIIFGGILLLCGGCFVNVIGSIGDSSSSSDRTTTTRPAATAPITAARTTTASPGFSDEEVNDLAYIATLKSKDVPFSSNQAVIDLGHAVCEALEAGNSETAIGLEISKKGFSLYHAGFIVGAAQSAYCPQFK